MHSTQIGGRISLLAVALPLGLTSGAVAGTIHVEPGLVEIAPDGMCSLREAIGNASYRLEGQLHSDCAAGDVDRADTIELHGGVFILEDEHYGSNGLPLIDGEIIINGNGAKIERDAGASEFRILQLDFSAVLTLNDVELIGGDVDGFGGAIRSVGAALTMNNCAISDNAATLFGGGIFSLGGPLTLIGCTITENSTGSSGGGIYSRVGTATIDYSAISENSATFAGGIYSETLLMTNCTVSGNSALNWSGAVFNDKHLTMTNCTLSGNSANCIMFAGHRSRGCYASLTNCTIIGNSGRFATINLFGDCDMTLNNCIVTNNVGADCRHSITFQVFLGANNLMDDLDGPCSGIRIGAVTGIDPNLSDNGGPTRTHALFAGSNAIDALPSSCAGDTDQRGVQRPQGFGCDIGAVEFVDCNDNGIDDGTDIAQGTSPDCQANGRPDECDLCGDLDGDGEVDRTDLTIFLLALGHAPGEAVFNACADFDGDGVVTQADFREWIRCFREAVRNPAAMQPGLVGLVRSIMADANSDGTLDEAEVPELAGLLIQQE